MRFRHLNGVTLSLLSGHTAIVSKDWRELPDMFYQEALVRGCEVDKTVIETRVDTETDNSDAADKPFDEIQRIRDALVLIKNRGVTGDFTNSGNPNLNVVAGLVGFTVRKETVLPLWREIENGGPLPISPDPTA